MIKSYFLLLLCFVGTHSSFGQKHLKWGDQKDGWYANPILPGDFQNTDVIRVDSIYYYISATKELSPGMMILSSPDLVNWKIIGHAVADITQIDARYNYDSMEGASRGIWAGAIRYHDSKFYIYFTDPDFGVFMTTSNNAEGPWEPVKKIISEAGWDDPCPFWDDDGQAYLVATHFSANYQIHLFKMTANGKALLTGYDSVIHQSEGSEANKIYKINKYYYHFYSEVSPEGRMPFMERSRFINGPYLERRQLIHKARREPNQGGLVQTEKGDWYFITHHGMSGWEGRQASLLPVTWTPDGWPVWGNVGKDGIGHMRWNAPKPIEKANPTSLQTSDDFDTETLAPQWEWYFQPRNDKWSLKERPGFLRLYASKPIGLNNIGKITNMLTQRPLRTDANIITIKLDVTHMVTGQKAALCLFGKTFADIGIKQTGNLRHFYFNNDKKIVAGPEITTDFIWLRSDWGPGGKAHFSYSTDGEIYQRLGRSFTMTNFGNYLGAKIGIYTTNGEQENGYVDVDWFNYNYDRHQSSVRL